MPEDRSRTHLHFAPPRAGSAGHQAQSSQTDTIGPLTVLVAGASAALADLLRDALSACGARRVICISQSDRVLPKLSDEPFDLIIVDYDPDDKGSIPLIQSLRRGENGRIPILMTIGLATADRIRDARDAGVDEILLKPMTIRGLAAKVNAAVNSRRPFIETTDYVGPDRRRGNTQRYAGPFRRAGDKPNSGQTD